MLTWVPTAIGIVLFLGASVVFLHGSRDKGTIETLTRSNAALDQNNKILEQRVTLLEASDTAKCDQIAALTHANEVLTNTVTSADLIKGLAKDLMRHHAAAMEGMERLHGDLDALPKRMAAVMKETD